MTFARKLLQHELQSLTPTHSTVSRRYAILYHVNDFVAGLTFVAGSVLFFWAGTERWGTWFFLVGSVLFTLRPAINVARDLHLTRLPAGEAPGAANESDRADGVPPGRPTGTRGRT